MKNTVIFVVVAAMLIYIVGFFTGFLVRPKCNSTVNTAVRVDTVRDTIHPEIPPPSIAYIVRNDTIYLRDTTFITIPITMQSYKTDDYLVTIEGYKPKLLDIELYPKTIFITNEKEVLRPVYYRRTWEGFVSASYSTLGVAGVGGGIFYNSLGLEYQFQYDVARVANPREQVNGSGRGVGHLFSLKWRF